MCNRQWWSTHNPLASRGESKEPKAPNASPEDSDADRREEERFRDIIERWWANLIRTSSPALENLQGNFAVALNSARQVRPRPPSPPPPMPPPPNP